MKHLTLLVLEIQKRSNQGRIKVVHDHSDRHSNKSGEKTRFFGLISQVTEDHPAGNMFPKWAVTMNVSHILELSWTGAISSDKISIGGALVDDGKYLL